MNNEKNYFSDDVSSYLVQIEVIQIGMISQDKEAFDTYQKYLKVISDIVLRKWQEDAMKLFDSPIERQVIWITDIFQFNQFIFQGLLVQDCLVGK